MITRIIRKNSLTALLYVGAGAFACAAGAAQAGTINYSDIVGNGFEITNISESNDLAGNVALYGQPTLTTDGSGIIFNTSTNPFTANAANGSSDFLRGILNFTVVYISPPQDTPNLTVTENGTFSGVGDAYATATPFLMLYDSNSNLITSVTGSISPTDPFLGGANNTQSAFTWQGNANASSGNPVSTFSVTLDNDLTAVSLDQGSSAEVDKKLVTIDICPDCSGASGTPEPASLCMVGLGALGLLIRRRRAV